MCDGDAVVQYVVPKSVLTIGYGQPSVLLLDFEVVSETVVAWVVGSVHVAVVLLRIIFVGRGWGP